MFPAGACASDGFQGHAARMQYEQPGACVLGIAAVTARPCGHTHYVILGQFAPAPCATAGVPACANMYATPAPSSDGDPRFM